MPETIVNLYTIQQEHLDFMRDARISPIYEGTNGIQRFVIARTPA